MPMRSGWRREPILDFSAVARYLLAMNAETPGKLSKFQRYRARKKAAGYKEVRRWVRDPNSPQFKAELEAFCEHQRNSKEEREINDFIEAMTADVLKDIPY
jgi:Protein  of unknown function (DUF3018)